MKHPIDEPTIAFHTVLENSEKLLLLIEKIKEFSSKNITDNDPDDDYSKFLNDFHGFAKTNLVNLTILSGTLLLYVAGQFEQYVKDCMMVVADEYASKCNTFDDLPSSMQSSLIYWTAETINHPAKYNYSKEDIRLLINKLSSNFNSQHGLTSINKECLVFTEQNMRPDTLSELLKRFEIKDVWKEISKQTSIKTYIENENENEVEKKIKEMLNGLMEDRNKIAHPSSNPVFPDSVKLHKYIIYLKELSKVISQLLIQKCKLYKTSTQCDADLTV